ncbi:hypothetical protein [Synechococcus sp. PCC 6312]|uniref:hypothetical protein n=1 Tax=Synechococcus sp. (strain ATCC 27167 / PCC 6312) TaxID=195253 RepID=UPI00029F14A7|nr:hypothetical protein [Synechococcus sp. PCC 6312]AFY61159.1 hypothetical protein Syn6312_2027 [Synechococcus sp. PCC 6312]
MLRLVLMTSPTLLVSAFSLLASVKPALAQTAITIPVPSPENQICIPSPHSKFQLVCTRANQASGPAVEMAKTRTTVIDPNAILEFTEEESNTAVQLFGCDCPLCLNALRALRNQPPLARG